MVGARRENLYLQRPRRAAPPSRTFCGRLRPFAARGWGIPRIEERGLEPLPAVGLSWYGLFSAGDQFGCPDVKCRSKRGDGGEGGSPLRPFDPADVVAVDAALKAELLLRDAALVA